MARLGGGQRRVCRHGVQHGTPQADLVGMGRVQQEIGAGLVGLDIAVLARADVAPQPQRERCAVAAEQAVPHQTACQADVPRGQAARVAAVGVFLPQTRVQAECCIFGQFLGQGGVQCVQSSMMTTPSRASMRWVPLGR